MATRAIALVFVLATAIKANLPPMFEGAEEDLVVRLREGAATPPGTRILRLKGSDPDGDSLVKVA